jgi:hypothetical protein
LVRIVAGLSAVCLALASASCGSPGEPDACDRDCLIGFADAWLAAIAAHAPERLALSEDFRFVENVTRMSIGEGLWRSAAGPATDFRIYVADPSAGTVGFMTVLARSTERGVVPAQLAARLLIRQGLIVEAEHVVADIGEEADASRLLAPRAGFTTLVPEPRQMSRSQLIGIANSYYESLDRSDGTLAPFAQDCERQENGMITAGPGLPPESFASVDVDGRSPPPVARDCIGQMSSRRFAYIDSIDNRRIFADPQLGLAMGFSHFRQSMARGPHPLIAADGSEIMWDERREPYDLPAAHIFRIADGEIHEVEAIGIFVPYASATGWE